MGIKHLNRGRKSPQTSYGAIAQLGERLPCTQEVRSSILLGSTILDVEKKKVKIRKARK